MLCTQRNHQIGRIYQIRRSGRPKRLSDRNIRELKRLIQSDNRLSAAKITTDLNMSVFKPMSKRSMRRYLKKLGYEYAIKIKNNGWVRSIEKLAYGGVNDTNIELSKLGERELLATNQPFTFWNEKTKWKCGEQTVSGCYQIASNKWTLGMMVRKPYQLMERHQQEFSKERWMGRCIVMFCNKNWHNQWENYRTNPCTRSNKIWRLGISQNSSKKNGKIEAEGIGMAREKLASQSN